MDEQDLKNEFPEYFEEDFNSDGSINSGLDMAIKYIDVQKNSCLKLNRRAPDRRWWTESEAPLFDFKFSKIKDGTIYFSMTPTDHDWDVFNKNAYAENFRTQENLITGFLEAIEWRVAAENNPS